eukprot:472-Pleurochrysis_carterae.AAC.2
MDGKTGCEWSTGSQASLASAASPASALVPCVFPTTAPPSWSLPSPASEQIRARLRTLADAHGRVAVRVAARVGGAQQLHQQRERPCDARVCSRIASCRIASIRAHAPHRGLHPNLVGLAVHAALLPQASALCQACICL